MSRRKPKERRSGRSPEMRGASETPAGRKRLFALLAALVGAGVLVAFFVGRDRPGSPSEPKKAASGATALIVGGPDAGYVEPGLCAECHPDVGETYQHSGMARSFFRPAASNMIEDFEKENTYYHAASDRHYTMVKRGGQYYQRRHQVGPDGRQTNVIEKEITFVMGSGNHARTYLHRTDQDTLVELPLGWYSEDGGVWAMNPGYDRPDHDGFQRKIGYDCMFCHNGYPEVRPGGDLYGSEPVFPGHIPEGIDCQRCHGPGRDHVQAAGAEKPDVERIRASILNPSRLDPERQMEVCLQCHLESSSLPLPYAILRYDRGAFSYQAGQPLADYVQHFDRAAPDDSFEIAHAAYRLRASECFQQSEDRLTCVTCHDPHHAEHGDEAASRTTRACLSCHEASLAKATAAGAHTAEQDCIACHMPKRRTEDAVHVVMTDHRIQRRKPARNLVAPLREHTPQEPAGEVVFYYPQNPPASPESELYSAVAQVVEGSNLLPGITRLEQAIQRHQPTEGEFYYELAQAYRSAGFSDKAIGTYEEALARKADYLPALVHLGETLAQAGDIARATEVLTRAAALSGEQPSLRAQILTALSGVQLQAERPADAERLAREAVQNDSELPAANNALGMALFVQGKNDDAAARYREAIRVEPRYADAHYNLANLLATEQNLDEAIRHYQQALAAKPDSAETHFNFGTALGMKQNYGEAKRHFTRAVEIDPDYHAAYLNLGVLESRAGNSARAKELFQKAAQSPDPAIRQAALAAESGGAQPPPSR